jgi:inosine triphosphate pyrophosphatase
MIIFTSTNADKVAEVKKYFQHPFECVKVETDEIQGTIQEIVMRKAHDAYKLLQKPVLVEDVSLAFDELGNIPGPYIKWWLKDPKMGLEGMCKLLDGRDRAATVTVCYGYHDGNNVYLFPASRKGSIATSPRGHYFGFSSIFIPHGYDKTMAEMSEDERAAVSYRKEALTALKLFLQNH